MSPRAVICSLAILVLAPVAAEAQFTTVTRPAPREEPIAAAATPAPEADSVSALQITSMQEWVDSVAAAAVEQGDTVVSLGDVATDTSISAAAGEAEGTTRFQEGAAAPDTATPLPLLALLGFLALGAGGMLLHRSRA